MISRAAWLTLAAAVCLASLGASSSLIESRANERGRSSSLAGVERSIRDCANRNRSARGLDPLLPSRALNQAARLQAQNMARLGFFDHVDPQGRDPEDRVRIFDPGERFTYVGENIAAGYESARQACVGWMHSPGHRANILRRAYTHIGGGYGVGGPYGRYYVQVFARSTEPVAEPSAALELRPLW